MKFTEEDYIEMIESRGDVIVYCSLYLNGDWEYLDENCNCHLYREGVELTKGFIAKFVWSYGNGDWYYEDEDGEVYYLKKDERPLV